MMEEKNEEYLNGWKRAQADLINYKKDEVKRLEEAIKFGNEILMRDLIMALDAFDLAMTSLAKEGPLDKGIYMIKSQLADILKRHGLQRLAVAVGQPFDPVLQEAVVANESDQPPNSVLEEMEAGYTLNGKLIRPARVRVAK